jgi:hypothetical protein
LFFSKAFPPPYCWVWGYEKRVGEKGRGIVTRFKKKEKITQYKAISKANSVSKSALMHVVHTISNQFRLASFSFYPSAPKIFGGFSS